MPVKDCGSDGSLRSLPADTGAQVAPWEWRNTWNDKYGMLRAYRLADTAENTILAASSGADVVISSEERARLIAAAPETAAERDRLRGQIATWIDMIENCAGVPTNPDSLPQMLLHDMRTALQHAKEPK